MYITVIEAAQSALFRLRKRGDLARESYLSSEQTVIHTL